MAKKSDVPEPKKAPESAKRTRISQGDVPAYSLTEALRVARAIVENYAGEATKPLDVAAAMGISPGSSTFKMLTGASIAYGLTDGGYNASTIVLSSLAKRITTPLEEGDDLLALREALVRPKIIGEFLQRYDGKQIPKDDIAANVVASLGAPRERSSDIFSLILEESAKLGLITDIKGKRYVNLRGASSRPPAPADPLEDSDSAGQNAVNQNEIEPKKQYFLTDAKAPSNKRVFITHGKNKAFVDPIKRLLVFGELEPVVSVESQSVSQPVPEKVMSDMRSCSAAIIHVAAEQVLMDKDANEHVMLNPNVLIEIGAAMALFGKRFILLVREGVKMPSNLQGLYEVRYSSDQLDGDATIRLMEVIKALKETPAPTEAH